MLGLLHRWLSVLRAGSGPSSEEQRRYRCFRRGEDSLRSNGVAPRLPSHGPPTHWHKDVLTMQRGTSAGSTI